jgi:hypothetical protein
MPSAVTNNAAWCDAICRAHGQPGEFHDSAWVNRGPTPEFYPNVISLADGLAPMRHVEQLLASGLLGQWGVKDSFGALPLGSLGFSLLFEGSWIWREPAGSERKPTRPSGWRCVSGAEELAKWEQAWSQKPTSGAPRIFPDSLLHEPGVLMLSQVMRGRIVGGLMANRTDAVVGISNRFGSADVEAELLAGLALVEKRFPGLPLVGYELDDGMGLAARVGFGRVGALRVWVRTTES